MLCMFMNSIYFIFTPCDELFLDLHVTTATKFSLKINYFLTNKFFIQSILPNNDRRGRLWKLAITPIYQSTPRWLECKFQGVMQQNVAAIHTLNFSSVLQNHRISDAIQDLKDKVCRRQPIVWQGLFFQHSKNYLLWCQCPYLDIFLTKHTNSDSLTESIKILDEEDLFALIVKFSISACEE